MADHLNMNGLSLSDSQHANGIGPRSTYIPPHLRGVPQQALETANAPPISGGLHGSAWAGPAG